MGKKSVDPSQVPLMKSEMVATAFEILMDAYIKSLGRCSSGQKVTITIKSYNRYIKFSGFREYFDICLYKSGDIAINWRGVAEHCSKSSGACLGTVYYVSYLQVSRFYFET